MNKKLQKEILENMRSILIRDVKQESKLKRILKWIIKIFHKKKQSSTFENISSFKNFAIPLIRTTMPSLVASQLVNVQPMSAPTGSIFYMNTIYGKMSEEIKALLNATIEEAIKGYSYHIKETGSILVLHMMYRKNPLKEALRFSNPNGVLIEVEHTTGSMEEWRNAISIDGNTKSHTIDLGDPEGIDEIIGIIKRFADKNTPKLVRI